MGNVDIFMQICFFHESNGLSSQHVITAIIHRENLCIVQNCKKKQSNKRGDSNTGNIRTIDFIYVYIKYFKLICLEFCGLRVVDGDGDHAILLRNVKL